VPLLDERHDLLEGGVFGGAEPFEDDHLGGDHIGTGQIEAPEGGLLALGAAGADGAHPVVTKMCFDASAAHGVVDVLPAGHQIVLAGCEAHVCVLQTVLGLLDLGRRVYLVRDALGSRKPENKETAIGRLERHGAEIVTTEKVVFEWLATAQHPRFRDALQLLK